MAVMAARPRVLHILSDWKWTGPAEPIVNLCRQLRRQGHMVDLACSRAPRNQSQALVHRARERLVEPVLDFDLRKKPNLLPNLRDLQRITRFIDREEVQIVHVHSSHDHLIGSRAARRANNQPRVVRTNHHGTPLRPTFFSRLLINGYTDGWVALSEQCLNEDLRHFDIHPDHAAWVEGTVDLDRFDPSRDFADVRSDLGIAPEEILIGIVARVQKHRRFDVLLRAFAKAMAEEPKLKGMIIGRGTHFDNLVREPVTEMGLADRILLPGYRNEDYPDYLAAFDVKVFLVPGSDGSCRAVREAMALGKPILAARRGILPQLVEDGRCGLVVEDTPEQLAAAMLRLARKKVLRERLGRAGAEKAHSRFGLDQQAEVIADLYQRLAEGL